MNEVLRKIYSGCIKILRFSTALGTFSGCNANAVLNNATNFSVVNLYKMEIYTYIYTLAAIKFLFSYTSTSTMI